MLNINCNNFSDFPDEILWDTISYKHLEGRCFSLFLVNKAFFNRKYEFINHLFRNINACFNSSSIPVKIKTKHVNFVIEIFGEIDQTGKMNPQALDRCIKNILYNCCVSTLSCSQKGSVITHHSQVNFQKIQQSLEALPQAWPRFRKAIMKKSVSDKGIPEDKAPVTKIYKFLVDPTNKEGLDKVENLYLAHLNLKIAPFGINLFRNLKALSLDNNNLENVPILDLPKLTTLRLQNNELVLFPEEFTGCPKLESLNLSKNKFKIFKINFCKSSPRLREFFITNCRLEKLSLFFFKIPLLNFEGNPQLEGTNDPRINNLSLI